MRCLSLFFCLMAFFLRSDGQPVVTSSPLPLLLIDTEGRYIQDEPKIDVNLKLVYNGEGKINQVSDVPSAYSGRIGIELRGSSSQMFPKKPYGFETRDNAGQNNDVSLLGMPKESDWVLNPTYNDKSLLRDAVTYILAGGVMEYAPRVRMTEVILNGTYEGVYLLTEKIKRDKGRVNIASLKPEDVSGDALTGGYILKLDKETGSAAGAGWNSDYPPFAGAWQRVLIQLDYPDTEDLQPKQLDYIRKYMQTVENTIAGTSFAHPTNGFRKYIDTTSLMDYIIFNELSKNPDAYRLSTYFYKERDSDGGMLKFGPVWDYNLGYGNVDYCTGPSPEGLVLQQFNSVCNGDYWVIHFWWKRFLQDGQFSHSLKQRWNTLRSGPLSDKRINTVTDSLISLLEPVYQRNFERWPVLGQYVWPNSFVGATWQQETWFFQDWMKKRLAYLDKVWKVEPVVPSRTPLKIRKVRPNPAYNELEVQWNTMPSQAVQLIATDVLGRMIPLAVISHSETSIFLDVSQLLPGAYCITSVSGEARSSAFFIKG
jgi:hypothetical protein